MITKEYLQQELRRRIESIKPNVNTKTDHTILEMESILVLVDALEDSKHLADARKTSPNDLEEAAKKYAHCPFADDDGNFHEDAIDETAYHNFIAGAKWQKEQMMKEAVEAELYWDGDFLAIDLDMTQLGYSEKDKVRIIIVKED